MLRNRQKSQQQEHKIEIHIVGIPRLINCLTDQFTGRKNDCVRGLYIYSSLPLTESDLENLDAKFSYPTAIKEIFPFSSSNKNKTNHKQAIMQAYDEQPISNWCSIYRKIVPFDKRYNYANIIADASNIVNNKLAIDTGTNNDVVILMPDDFHLETDKRGYFNDLQTKLIINIFTKYSMTKNFIERHHSPQQNKNSYISYSIIDTENSVLLEYIVKKITQLGFHEIFVHSNKQVVGFDDFFTLVVGPIHNLTLFNQL